MWKTLLGLGGSILGAGINYHSTKRLNQENAELNQQYWDKQAKTTFGYNEQAADNAMQRSLDLYNMTQSPKAMVKQLKEAGLNPALMYSNSGMGGHTQSGPQGGSNGGNGAPTLGLQNFVQFDPLTLAQIKNIQADTKNKEANTKKTEWDTQISAWNAEIAELDKKLKEQTFGISYAKMYTELQKLVGEAESAVAKGYIDEMTKDTQIQLAVAELANRQYQLEVMKSVKGLNEQQKEKLQIDIIKMGQEIQNLIIEGELTEKKIWEINQKYGWNFNKEDLKWSINSIIDLIDTFVPNPFKGKGKKK